MDILSPINLQSQLPNPFDTNAQSITDCLFKPSERLPKAAKNGPIESHWLKRGLEASSGVDTK